VDCYREQTYPNKELIILCEDNNPSLSQIKQLGEAPDITVIVQSTNPKLTLGELRNISIEQSSGEYFCQWDDDDWYHPDRIQKQYDFVIESGIAGCCLDQRIVYDKREEQLYMSPPPPWNLFEGSILMRKDVATNTSMYSSRNTAEDTDFILPLVKSGKLKGFNAPHLYVYVYHGDNVWEREHFEEIFETSQKITDESLRKVLLY
jgi:glycosyltransferase involved in cell wall biosynthesis